MCVGRWYRGFIDRRESCFDKSSARINEDRCCGRPGKSDSGPFLMYALFQVCIEGRVFQVMSRTVIMCLIHFERSMAPQSRVHGLSSGEESKSFFTIGPTSCGSSYPSVASLVRDRDSSLRISSVLSFAVSTAISLLLEDNFMPYVVCFHVHKSAAVNLLFFFDAGCFSLAHSLIDVFLAS